jgi:hypothetical protein
MVVTTLTLLEKMEYLILVVVAVEEVLHLLLTIMVEEAQA